MLRKRGSADQRARARYTRLVVDTSFVVVTGQTGSVEALHALCTELEDATGTSIEPVALDSYEELTHSDLLERPALVWAPPLVAIELEDAGLARPVVAVHRGSRAGYHAALLGRRDSDIRTAEDLARARGLRAVWVGRDSASGYLVPRWYLMKLGADPDEVFTQQRFVKTHAEVVRAVASGEADGGATHASLDPVSGDLLSAPWLEVGASQRALRVLALIGPIPGDVVCASTALTGPARRHLIAALLALPVEGAVRSLFQSAHLDPVAEGHLDELRRFAKGVGG